MLSSGQSALWCRAQLCCVNSWAEGSFGWHLLAGESGSWALPFDAYLEADVGEGRMILLTQEAAACITPFTFYP